MTSDPLRQLRDRNPERVGDFLDVPQGHIPLAPLDSTDIGTIKAAGVCEPLLRIPLAFAQRSHALPKHNQKLFVWSMCHPLSEVV